MPGIIYDVLIYLLAVYGALTLIFSIASSVYYRTKTENRNVKLVLVVKNKQDIIEYFVGCIFKGSILKKVIPGGKLTVLDMGSSDETRGILDKLKRDYEYIDIIKEEEKEKIFQGFV